MSQGKEASLPVPGITERGQTPTRAGPGAGRQAARVRTRLAFRLVTIEQHWVMLLPPDEPELEGGGTTRRGVPGLVYMKETCDFGNSSKTRGGHRAVGQEHRF